MPDFLFSSFVAADAKLFGVHVPRLGTGEGIQHEPHHTQTLAGNVNKGKLSTQIPCNVQILKKPFNEKSEALLRVISVL